PFTGTYHDSLLAWPAAVGAGLRPRTAALRRHADPPGPPPRLLLRPVPPAPGQLPARPRDAPERLRRAHHAGTFGHPPRRALPTGAGAEAVRGRPGGRGGDGDRVLPAGRGDRAAAPAAGRAARRVRLEERGPPAGPLRHHRRRLGRLRRRAG